MTDLSMDHYAEQEIFEAAGINDVERVRDLLDSGVDINLQDFDKGWTPLHVAAARGSKQTIELLVQRGCDINCQDNRGSTALHSLVYKRFDALALWLVRNGADMNIPDQRGFSPKDNALDWFQKELEAAASAVDEEKETSTPVATPPPTKKADETSRLPEEEVMKVYLRNNSYKSIKVSRNDTCAELGSKMAGKLNMPEHHKYFEVLEVIKTEERHMHPSENVLKSKSKWPMIFGATGNETHLHCHFTVELKRAAPPEVHQQFEQAFV